MNWRRMDGQPIKIEQPNWSALTNIQYSASSQGFGNLAWFKNERKYMQGFLQCTKNCLLKKFQQCTERKECAPQLAALYDFRRQTRECTKRNTKITLALFRTCQCLAWAKGVTDLHVP
ncbi:hypothetical protein PRIPAC_77825 [Pristionchus pacificus]|uniref:Uncharacterized protein n=1 Tax=Pristionchus pacificus TaxID=54126 RepID=A0A2A6BHA3_PRIPA|nr:hypothetical protein PRIPAC_77825 [Pristionchus pacificus]|eukprot:PDM65272.1 hypothetical protein PRIPAC_52214 [Pristionchus pacificus]